MIEMSRDVWRSSPNVISHLEKEADKHLQDDEIRKEKVRQLKVRNAIFHQEVQASISGPSIIVVNG